MLPILEFIDENVIGGKTKFEGPYGEKRGTTLEFFAKKGMTIGKTLSWLKLS